MKKYRRTSDPSGTDHTGQQRESRSMSTDTQPFYQIVLLENEAI